MRMLRSCFPAILTLCVWQSPQDPWARADSATVRLAPSRFRTLPSSIIRDLERRSCRVPQVYERLNDSGPTNVIRGSYIVPGRTDWAVLCSIRDTSRILIYRNAATAPIDSLAKGADRHSLQGLGDNRIGYSRKITTASPAYIRRVAKPDTATTLPNVDHAGIEDHFVGKASVIWYFQRGRWLMFLGGD